MNFESYVTAPSYLPLKNWQHKDYCRLPTTKLQEYIEQFVDPKDILFIFLFGSAFAEPKFEFVKKKFLGVIPYTKKIRITSFANDIDIFVVCHNNYQNKNISGKCRVDRKVGDSYGWDWADRELPGILHVQIAWYENILKAVKDRDVDALNTVRDATLLSGNLSKFNELRMYSVR